MEAPSMNVFGSGKYVARVTKEGPAGCTLCTIWVWRQKQLFKQKTDVYKPETD